MCKEHHKAEMYTLKAGTGEKLVFNRPNQKRFKKAGPLFFTLLKVPSVHFSQFCLSLTPLDFLYSVWVLGLLALDQAPQ